MVLLASDYDKSRYFKAADLEREKKFRIKSVTEEAFGTDSDKEKKLVVWFTNDERGLVLNKTNNRTIRGAFGDDVAGWAGKIIVDVSDDGRIRGKMVPALRVRIPPPKQAAAAAHAAQPAATGSGQRSASCGSAPPAKRHRLRIRSLNLIR